MELEGAGTPVSGSLPPYRLLVTGWRFWPRTNAFQVHSLLLQIRNWLPADRQMIVAEGACPYDGVDAYAHEWATANADLNIITDRDPAKWKVYDRAAGPLRNQAMVDKGPNFFLAFPQFRTREEAALRRARRSGTHDCIERAVKAGVGGYINPWVGDPMLIQGRMRQATLFDIGDTFTFFTTNTGNQ